MPYWIFCLGLGVLTSAIFRYITTDALFYDDFKNLYNRKDRLNYILSKNIFTILFVGFIILISSLVIGTISKIFLIRQIDFEFKSLLTLIFYILGAENIILIFNKKIIPSYKSGHKRNIKEDIIIGTENLKSMMPSLFVNIILIIFIFIFKIDLTSFVGIVYLLASIVIFAIYKTS